MAPHAPALAGIDAQLTRALRRVMSLQDGDEGVLDVVACGTAAIAPLRTLLFTREPSGLYQSRCHVVEALAALGARDVLREFVFADRDFADPVERAGEEAVLNAALRALRGADDETFFQRLLAFARIRRLVGAIELLGALRRPDALPCLTVVLADDMARDAASDALRQYGGMAVPDLAVAATDRDMRDGAETESSRRRRRAALEVLRALGDAASLSASQRAQWMLDDNAEIAACGCWLACERGAPAEWEAAVQRLLALLPAVAWHIREQIEDCLVRCGGEARALIQSTIPATPPDAADFSPAAAAQWSLIRVARRLAADEPHAHVPSACRLPPSGAG